MVLRSAGVRHTHALIILGHGAGSFEMLHILADIEPAMRCVTQPLAAIAAVTGEAAVPILVLALVHALLRHAISTISDYQAEDSALGRILVWQWTLQFVGTHPAGGGFNAYQVNEVRFPPNAYNPEGVVVRGKAFHSVYFEVLGEHGWPGIILFAGLIVTSLLSLQKIARRARDMPQLTFCRDLAFALQVSLIVMLSCGLFIGVAFQPMIYYLFALAACLSHHAQQVELRNVGPPKARGATTRQAIIAPIIGRNGELI